MAEQTPSGFVSVSRDTSDIIQKEVKKRIPKKNPDIPVADNVDRWRNDKAKQFTPQEPPKGPRSSNAAERTGVRSTTGQIVDKVGNVKSYLVNKKKQNMTKPDSVPINLVRNSHHPSTNPLKEFKYSAYDGKQVMR